MSARAAYRRMTPEKQLRILETTLQLVRERGYGEVTIEEIATLCDSSKATIYRFWPGKPALVAAALLHAMPTAEQLGDAGSLRGDMLRLFRLPESEPEFDPFMIATIVTMGFESPEVFAATNRDIVDALTAIIGTFLDRAAARGEHHLTEQQRRTWTGTCICYAIGYAPAFGSRLTQDDFARLYDTMLAPALRSGTTS